jgi:hypothetical protein
MRDRKLEERFDDRLVRAVAQHLGAHPSAEDEVESVDEDGLARAGLAREHVQARAKADLDGVHDREARDSQRREHADIIHVSLTLRKLSVVHPFGSARSSVSISRGAVRLRIQPGNAGRGGATSTRALKELPIVPHESADQGDGSGDLFRVLSGTGAPALARPCQRRGVDIVSSSQRRRSAGVSRSPRPAVARRCSSKPRGNSGSAIRGGSFTPNLHERAPAHGAPPHPRCRSDALPLASAR